MATSVPRPIESMNSTAGEIEDEHPVAGHQPVEGDVAEAGPSRGRSRRGSDDDGTLDLVDLHHRAASTAEAIRLGLARSA